MNDYPQSAVNIAKRVLKFKDENPKMKCGTRVGWARANQISKRENLSLETVKRTYSFLSRAQTYDTGLFKDEKGVVVCGSVMFAAWGGEPMLKWTKKVLEREKINSMKKIQISGTIGTGQGSAEYFNYLYKEIDINDEIEVEISSLGGDFFAAVEIFSKLKKHGGKTHAIYSGLCASAATLIASACDEVSMYDTGAILIHDLSQYIEVMGQLKKEDFESLVGELRRNIDNLESLNKLAVKMYKRKTGRTDDEIKNLMAQDRWILSDEALEFGLIDKIIEDEKGVKAEVKIAASKQLKNRNKMDLKSKILEYFAQEEIEKKEAEKTDRPKNEITEEVQVVFDEIFARLESIEMAISEMKRGSESEDETEAKDDKEEEVEMAKKTDEIENRISKIENRDQKLADVLQGFVDGVRKEISNQNSALEKKVNEKISELQLRENSVVTGDRTFEDKNLTTAEWVEQLKNFN